ncbi:MAG: hydrogenase maturation nickel metallochaperone HypA [Deltaproteobacteria bacterium]|nr:hydrogenase maturation nickel metallochaperone HypA [Deltaproteobacteria bacterium]
MHEYGIVQTLLDRVLLEADSRSAISVKRLHVRIGELAGVEPELLTWAWETFREHTLCAEAVLEVETVPARWVCPGCGADIASGGLLRCPDCDMPARLEAGQEIILQRIEMEIPDV